MIFQLMMKRTVFYIRKMDCPSEESLIRMKLDGLSVIKKLDFDIENRNLTVYHSAENQKITSQLEELNLGAKLSNTSTIKDSEVVLESSGVQSKLLWSVLIINFVFFVIEMTTGIFSKSM